MECDDLSPNEDVRHTVHQGDVEDHSTPPAHLVRTGYLELPSHMMVMYGA